MRPLKNLFFVKADPSLETKYVMPNGVEIWISPPVLTAEHKVNKNMHFSPYQRAVQIAEVVYCPMKVTSEYIYDTPLQPGDIVITHHFVVQPDNIEVIGDEKLYKAAYHQLFAIIRNGEIVPLHDYLFCEPVYENESKTKSKAGLFLKSKPDQIPLTCKVLYACKSASEKGIEVGDVVRFDKDSDYWIEVNKKRYWRMSVARISMQETGTIAVENGVSSSRICELTSGLKAPKRKRLERKPSYSRSE